MLDLLDKIPEEGDTFELTHDDKKFTLVINIMDGYRIDKISVLIEEIEPSADEDDE